MGKRKNLAPHGVVNGGPVVKKRAGSKLNPANILSKSEALDNIKKSFADNLLDDTTKKSYREQYAQSEPYKHAVIQPLIDDALLRNVRTEILSNLHFTRKETDIYRIHQSGDLANLSGLPASKLKLLPSLLQLRNAMYSKAFREYVSNVTACGPLSGSKTDMAINVYTKGCHLLCHDDVIGSRRVSYILYLTDPDDPWQPQWGGALRLYPTEKMADGESLVPTAGWTKVIPPAWNQLSFFAVQPGESFHDVEEVYKEGKVRMAISGWFHIPQKGEDGFIEGEEERLAEKSSLQQLQAKADTYDLPQPNPCYYENPEAETNDDTGKQTTEGEEESDILTEEDCDYLLRYINAAYLMPDNIEAIARQLRKNQSIQIPNFLGKHFAARVKEYVERRDTQGKSIQTDGWSVARPPHKQRFLYLQDKPIPQPSKPNKGKKKAHPEDPVALEENPIQELLAKCFASKPFQKLLNLAMPDLKLTGHDLLGRCFRRGLDYTLATGWEPDEKQPKEGEMKVELCLGLTPTSGWEGEEEEEDEEEEEIDEEDEDEEDDSDMEGFEDDSDEDSDDGDDATKAMSLLDSDDSEDDSDSDDSDSMTADKLVMSLLGGHPGLSRGLRNDNGEGPSTSSSSSSSTSPSTSPGAPGTSSASSTPADSDSPFVDQPGATGGYEMYMNGEDDDEADAAIYKTGDDDDDGPVFTMGAAWNKLSIVLRDGGLLKFVKYVSRDAPGHRWDVVGAWGAIPTEGESGSDDSSEENSDEDGDEDGDSDGSSSEDYDDGKVWGGIEEELAKAK